MGRPRNRAQLATPANPLVIDIEASLVYLCSEKVNQAGTYKGEYGFSLKIAMAGYGKANGTEEVLDQALAQWPDDLYDERENLIVDKILVRTDSADASREFLHYSNSLGIQFSTPSPCRCLRSGLSGG